MANGVNAKKKRAQPWNEIYSTSILRPYAELMPQSIVFIYQNVCKKVPSSILQYSYVIFLPLLACGFGFPNQFLIFTPSSSLFLFLWISIYLSVLSVYFSAHMPRTLTYSPCVPYADTISYKFHLLIFLKNILILSVILFLSVIRFRNWIESSQIRCSLSFVIILNVTLKPNNNNNNDGKRRDRDRGKKYKRYSGLISMLPSPEFS